MKPEELLHAKEVLELLTVFTGDSYFEKAYNDSMKGSDVDMVSIMDTYAQQCKEQERTELIDNYVTKLKKRHPDWNDEQIQEEVDYFFVICTDR